MASGKFFQHFIALDKAQRIPCAHKYVKLRAQYLLVASFVMKSATAISLPFLLFIYIDGNIHEDVAPQLVWSANQKNPISINATLRLSSKRGLVLKDANRTTVWYTNIGAKSVASLNLSDMGNLMLLNQKNKTIRQSFDHPTDSLLPGQKLMSKDFDEAEEYDLDYVPGMPTRYSITRSSVKVDLTQFLKGF
nr:epidermis-specific secreted glycoprotein ep1 [Quercus suber]